MVNLPDVSSPLGAPFGRVNTPAGFWNRPCAAKGLISYRCKSPYGWIMIGARNHDEALSEARRSSDGAERRHLEIWDASQQAYVPIADGADIPPQSAVIKFTLQRVPIDRGGYDSGGAYWGEGAPLYWASAMVADVAVDRYFRAADRAGAKETIRAEFPDATFYR